MKLISYILLLFFVLSISGRINPWYSVKKQKKVPEAKCTSESSDLDEEESKTDDKDENEKENSEKFIALIEAHIYTSPLGLLNTHNLFFQNLLLSSRIKEVIIPPPEQA